MPPKQRTGEKASPAAKGSPSAASSVDSIPLPLLAARLRCRVLPPSAHATGDSDSDSIPFVSDRVLTAHPDALRSTNCLTAFFAFVNDSREAFRIVVDELQTRDQISVHASVARTLGLTMDSPMHLSPCKRLMVPATALLISVAGPSVRHLKHVEALATSDLSDIPVYEGLQFPISFLGNRFTCNVLKIAHEVPDVSVFLQSNGHVLFSINANTKLTFRMGSTEQSASEDAAAKTIRLAKLQVAALSEQQLFISSALTNMMSAARSACRLLVVGAPGTGKSSLAKYCIAAAELPCVEIASGSVTSKYFGESEHRLRMLFREAALTQPGAILIDDIDLLCPHRDDASNESVRRIATTLLQLISDLPSQVAVIATTSKPDALDPALRRPGRLDHEVQVLSPTAKQRVEILQLLLRRQGSELPSEDVEKLGLSLHGYVGSDISVLIEEAVRFAKQRGEQTIVVEDLKLAAKIVRPSALREIQLEIPSVKWTDVGGQESVKQALKEAVEWPLQKADLFAKFGIRPLRGILMYGPPGCSKTMLAKAIATESGLSFIAVKGPELLGKYVGESEQAVRGVFRKARSAAPCVVFFDEIDSLATARRDAGSSVNERVLSQLLAEMDGMHALRDVVVIAATNRPDVLDAALLRPGRFDRLVYVPLPDADTRRAIWRLQLSRMPVKLEGEGLVEDWVNRSEGYSGAEIVAVCKEAALCALEENIHAEWIYQQHMEAGLRRVKPRITPESIRFYESFAKKSSGLVAK